jgi:hypothetical protein
VEGTFTDLGNGAAISSGPTTLSRNITLGALPTIMVDQVRTARLFCPCIRAFVCRSIWLPVRPPARSTVGPSVCPTVCL